MPPADHAPRPQEVRLTDETISYLEQQIQKAVADGIKGAITEETARQFWAAGLSVLQQQAQEKTGKFVLGGIWGAVRKLTLFLALGIAVYNVGGWTALAKIWVAIKGGP